MRKGADPKNDLDKLINAIVRNKNRIQTVGYNSMKGMLVRRIFNTGQATDGSQIGTYAPLSIRLRSLAGRQTSRVDLEFTGTLRKSMAVGRDGDNIVFGMLEQREPKTKIVKGKLVVSGLSDVITTENAIEQEKNFSKEIFAPSEEEINRGEKAILKEVNIIAKKALR